jgi:hypothetical protein
MITRAGTAIGWAIGHGIWLCRAGFVRGKQECPRRERREKACRRYVLSGAQGQEARSFPVGWDYGRLAVLLIVMAMWRS